ncbi:unnamed protein product [Sphagnum jensenii]|uniref:Pentatricopeptide repeat-containing protein n=1 Tax=Sphagnum jensenii TaxID=128206 RepID=A0ABP1BQG3_9BRYO
MTAMPPGTVQRDIFSWNAKLAQFVKGGQHQKAMKLFQQMQQEGLSPDKLTFLRVLNACAGLRALDEGRRIHSQIIESGSHGNVEMGEVIAKQVLALDPGNSAEYVRSNIYTAAAKWNPPANVQHQKLERGMRLEYRGQ